VKPSTHSSATYSRKNHRNNIVIHQMCYDETSKQLAAGNWQRSAPCALQHDGTEILNIGSDPTVRAAVTFEHAKVLPHRAAYGGHP
jgi:hypothetical protein